MSSQVSYKEVSAQYVAQGFGSAVGKSRAVIEAALQSKLEVDTIIARVANAEHGQMADKPVFGEKKGYQHETTQAGFLSLSAHIRKLFDEGVQQTTIAKQLHVRPQMVSNVIRTYKLKLAEEGEAEEGEDDDKPNAEGLDTFAGGEDSLDEESDDEE